MLSGVPVGGSERVGMLPVEEEGEVSEGMEAAFGQPHARVWEGLPGNE